jgi:subtilisin family serine protease
MLGGVALATVTTLVGVATGSAAFAAPPEGEVRGAGAADAVKDSFIVVLKDTAAGNAEVSNAASNLTSTYGGSKGLVYSHAVKGFSARMSLAQAKRLAADGAVAYVQQDRKVKKSDTQPGPPSWGLDRIDQTALPLDNTYTYPSTASSVHAYVVDTGIRISHQDFGGRASYGASFDPAAATADDCDGHGTHVAGTLGSTQHGVAKGVQLVAVRVLDCQGSGTESTVIAGIDWVTANAVKPAVANLSVGGPASGTIDAALQKSIASGVTYTVAAGNDGRDACGFSPARVPEAITVGATDDHDFRATFSNFGNCVDIFAPGVDIKSTYIDPSSNAATAYLSGTSMASPHVAGAAALVLAANPNLTPQQVRDAIVNNSVAAAVHDPGTGSPESLLHVGPAPTSSAPFGLRARVNGGWVAADNSGNAPLIANRTSMGAWEEFDQVDAGNGYIALRAHVNGRFVSADNGGNSPLIANRTAIGDWEKFKVNRSADGSLSLQAFVNGRFVSADNGGNSPLIANRTAVGAWETFDRVAPPAVISLAAAINNRVVTADNGGNSPLIANRTSIGAWEGFDQVDAGNGYIALRAHANGRYVTAANGGNSPLIANRTAIGPWELFKVIHVGDGTIGLLANANGRFVCADNGGNSPLIANRTAIGAWESFWRI